MSITWYREGPDVIKYDEIEGPSYKIRRYNDYYQLTIKSRGDFVSISRPKQRECRRVADAWRQVAEGRKAQEATL